MHPRYLNGSVYVLGALRLAILSFLNNAYSYVALLLHFNSSEQAHKCKFRTSLHPCLYVWQVDTHMKFETVVFYISFNKDPFVQW